MNIQKAYDQILKLFRNPSTMNEPVLLLGAPGLGKTSIAQPIADEMNLRLIEIRIAEFDTPDLRGLCRIDEDTNTTRWSKAEIWEPAASEPCLILLDEISQATPDMLSPLMKILLGLAIGDLKLHPETRIICTGNRVEDRAGCHRLPSALRERAIELTIEANARQWLNWYDESPHRNEAVAAFISENPEALHQWDGRIEHNQPTPRSWEKVGRILEATEDCEMIAGAIGQDMAEGFLRWHRDWKANALSLAEIIDDPSKMPTKPLQLGAISEKIGAAIAKKEWDDETLRQLLEELPASWQVVALRAAAELDSTAIFRDAFDEIFDKHSDAITAK